MLQVTALYAGLLGLYCLWLAKLVIAARGRHGIALGTDHVEVLRAVRAHGNFAEYVPLALLMLALCEANGLPPAALHALGALLVVGRVLHATGIAREPEDFRWRGLGMGLTFAMIGVASVALLWGAVAGL
jgi:uncharacterized membrane protein YecN with MAPEG domain